MAEIKTVLTDDQIEDAANSCDFGSMVTASDYIYVLARAIEAAVLSANAGKDALPAYTTGHCEHNSKPGGCQQHNLHCGWPKCDQKETNHA